MPVTPTPQQQQQARKNHGLTPGLHSLLISTETLNQYDKNEFELN